MVNNQQPSNIPPIFVTFEVLKLERSRVVKEEQPLNIPFISVTWEVSNLETSSVRSALHPANIPLMSVTSEVLRLSNPRISVTADKPSNQLAVVLGTTFRNDSSMIIWVISSLDVTSLESHSGVLWSFCLIVVSMSHA